MVAVVILGAAVLCAVAAPLIAPHDPLQGTLSNSVMPPVWSDGGSWTHPLGTDQLGRDTLSRLIWGARITLQVALAGVLFAGILGSLLGVAAGYLGGVVDEAIMRIADAALAIPILVLGLALAAGLGPGTGNVIVVVSALTWAFFARLVRGEVLRVRSADYVTAARLVGLPTRSILRRHVLPNVMNGIIVMATLQVGQVVIIAASLSFLGLGVPQPAADWGLMLADAVPYISFSPIMAIAPAVAISAAVLSANVLGDWARDRLDPMSRSRFA
jgi:peptide/nickel transport system permease protein